MGLSEHEQQAFEQLEQAMHDEDPMFFQRVRVEHIFLYARRRLQLAILGLVTGLGLMVTFCFTTQVVVGVLGFLVMVVSLDTFWAKTRERIVAGADDIAHRGTTTGFTDTQVTRPGVRHWFGHSR